MTVYTFDPLRDSRWPDLVDRHPSASVFHTRAWLQALERTYGYEPVGYTTTAPGAETLTNGIVFCAVRSWLTGRRLVSLPFSDHCEPLVTGGAELNAMAAHLDGIRRQGRWSYIELRPHAGGPDGSQFVTASAQFWFHQLDLGPPIDSLFAAFHSDSVQRKIRRAEREALVYEQGAPADLLRTFYELLVITRGRHHLPPQPFTWFRNLADAFGDALTVRVVRHRETAIAAMLTLRHREVMVYKYGASDHRFHPLGGMQLLFWRAIQDARASGCTTVALGRSDADNHGLATSKARWGAARSTLTYWRCTHTPQSQSAVRTYVIQGARQVLDHAPRACRTAAGKLLYKHAG